MARILYITQIDIDDGAVRLLPEECHRAGMKRPLVVTDAGVRAAGVLDKALAALGDLPHAVFDQTPSNPTEAAVRAACAVYKACAQTSPTWLTRISAPASDFSSAVSSVVSPANVGQGREARGRANKVRNDASAVATSRSMEGRDRSGMENSLRLCAG